MSPFLPSNKMYREQAKIIREIAAKEGGVFLGRCADAVLEGYPECYQFFIYADEAFRSSRAKELYGSKSLKELEKENKTRERYYNYYTGKKWGDPLNYVLMINTSRYSMKRAADLIWDYVSGCQPE